MWRTTLKRRLLVAILLLTGWAVTIEGRLAYLQIFRHAEMSALAENQQVRTIETTPKRGDILDRNGNVLAFSVEADSIYAVPTDIGDPDAAAAALCRALQDCSARERQALSERIRRARFFAYVRRQGPTTSRIWPTGSRPRSSPWAIRPFSTGPAASFFAAPTC
jgi:cell division protein FtsI/penicillin-binding protein 2